MTISVVGRSQLLRVEIVGEHVFGH
jgi:hypothetical protein